jgi:thiosulfate dehydrogenase (quinone) large subunit
VSTGPVNIIEDNALAVGNPHNFTSKSGSPAVLFKTKTGIFAYSAVCTHQGCTVTFNSASRNLQCPCHGAVFSPESDGSVLAGPTNTPLPRIKVAVAGAWIVEA